LMSDGNNVLVTGGAGYIGSHVVLALRDTGWHPVVIDDLSSGHRSLVPADIPFVKADIADRTTVARVIDEYRASAVIHLAGSIIVSESVTQPLAYYRNNVEGSRALIETCIAEGIESFVFSSSASVYGRTQAAPVNETAPVAPINPYGRTKLITEWMLEDIARISKMKFAALRYFNVAGADPDGRSGQLSKQSTHLIKVACEVAAGKRDSMAIFGDDYDTPDGTCVRDYIHVADLADAHVKVLADLKVQRENLVLNCGYGMGVSVKSVIDMVQVISGKSLRMVIAPRRDGDPPYLVADASRLRERLNWQPRFNDLRTIVTSALRWEISAFKTDKR
jgi:UDP-glucose 4-epimerase